MIKTGFRFKGESATLAIGVVLGVVVSMLCFLIGIQSAKADELGQSFPYYGGGLSFPYQTGGVWYKAVRQRFTSPADGYISKISFSSFYNSDYSSFEIRWAVWEDDNGSLGDNLYQSDWLANTALLDSKTHDTDEMTDFVLPEGEVYVGDGDSFFFTLEADVSDLCSSHYCITSFRSTNTSPPEIDRVNRCTTANGTCYSVSGWYLTSEWYFDSLACSNTPSLCLNQTDCETAGWYWHNGSCREDQTPLTPSFAQSPLFANSQTYNLYYECIDAGEFYGFNSGTGSGQGALADLGYACSDNSNGYLPLAVEQGENLWKLKIVAGGLSSPEAQADIYWNPESGLPTPVWLDYTHLSIHTEDLDVNVHCTNDLPLYRTIDGGTAVSVDDCVSGQIVTDSLTVTQGFHNFCWYVENQSGGKSAPSCMAVDFQSGTFDCMGNVGGFIGFPEGSETEEVESSGIFTTAYSALAHTPIIGDLLYVDCVIWLNFYSNLAVVDTTDPSVHVTAFNFSQDVDIPFQQVKNSLVAWTYVSGYSDFKPIASTVLWILVIVSLLGSFVFPFLFRGRGDQKDDLYMDKRVRMRDIDTNDNLSDEL